MAGKSTRQAFGEALARLGAEHPEIVTLDADLTKSTKSELFAKKFPDRFFQMGIAEANMIGTAAGLAFAGKLPFLCSFGAFLTGRYDTIRLSVAYAQANVRMVGTHAGVGIGDDGHSQMGLEDVALMRALPTMGVFQPMDARQCDMLMNFLVRDWKGPAYIRLTRQNLPDLMPAGVAFHPKKLLELRKGNGEVAIIGTGACTAEAMIAADLLKDKGIQAAVWDAHSLKPFDDEATVRLASTVKLLVTVEDHTVIGGLGSCVAEALAHSTAARPQFLKLGVQDAFGQSGEGFELYDLYGISGKAVADKISTLLRR